MLQNLNDDMSTSSSLNIGSGIGLVPTGHKPLPEPMLHRSPSPYGVPMSVGSSELYINVYINKMQVNKYSGRKTFLQVLLKKKRLQL